MTIWDVRQAIESSIPWWAPLIPIILIVFLAITQKKPRTKKGSRTK